MRCRCTMYLYLLVPQKSYNVMVYVKKTSGGEKNSVKQNV